jgi:protoheme ferro-lyase
MLLLLLAITTTTTTTSTVVVVVGSSSSSAQFSYIESLIMESKYYQLFANTINNTTSQQHLSPYRRIPFL